MNLPLAPVCLGNYSGGGLGPSPGGLAVSSIPEGHVPAGHPPAQQPQQPYTTEPGKATAALRS